MDACAHAISFLDHTLHQWFGNELTGTHGACTWSTTNQGSWHHV